MVGKKNYRLGNTRWAGKETVVRQLVIKTPTNSKTVGLLLASPGGARFEESRRSGDTTVPDI